MFSKFSVFVVSSFLFVVPVKANQDDLKSLTELLSRHERFTAAFQQYTINDGGSRQELAAGHVWIQQPDQFRWETETPFPQLILSDGQSVWVYDEDLEQVTQRPAGGQGALTPAAVLGGDLQQLSKNFNVQLVDSGANDKLYELQPLSDNSVDFISLRLLFNQGNLSELMIRDGLGQRSLIMLESLTFPEFIDPEFFEFTVPEGVDLIQDMNG